MTPVGREAYARCDLVSSYTAEQSCKIDSYADLQVCGLDIEMYSKFVKVVVSFLSHLPRAKKVGWFYPTYVEKGGI